MKNPLTIIDTPHAPKPNGHYSQAIEANGFIFTSVQLGVTSEKHGAVSQQLTNALLSIEQILLSAGSGLSKIVKLTIYIVDISAWQEANEVVAKVFGDHKPARGIIPVTALHMGAEVAVDAIAVK